MPIVKPACASLSLLTFRYFNITLFVKYFEITFNLSFLLFIAVSGDVTWYNPGVGLTACGTHHNDNELIAATAFHYWTNPNPNNDPMCQRRARITNPSNGKSVEVQIRDKCAACRGDDIDLSKGAFERIADLGVGRFRGNWQFI